MAEIPLQDGEAHIQVFALRSPSVQDMDGVAVAQVMEARAFSPPPVGDAAELQVFPEIGVKRAGIVIPMVP